jgi:hypothetical protein
LLSGTLLGVIKWVVVEVRLFILLIVAMFFFFLEAFGFLFGLLLCCLGFDLRLFVAVDISLCRRLLTKIIFCVPERLFPIPSEVSVRLFVNPLFAVVGKIFRPCLKFPRIFEKSTGKVMFIREKVCDKFFVTVRRA